MQQQNQEMQQQEGGEEYFRFQFQNGVCQKVMTDEQIEELRKHIAAYAVISEQLAEMHKAAMSAHQDFSGFYFFIFFSLSFSFPFACNVCFWFSYYGLVLNLLAYA